MDILGLVLSWEVECRSRVFILHKSKSGEQTPGELKKYYFSYIYYIYICNRATPARIPSAKCRVNLPCHKGSLFLWPEGKGKRDEESWASPNTLHPARHCVKACNCTLISVLTHAGSKSTSSSVSEGTEQSLTKRGSCTGMREQWQPRQTFLGYVSSCNIIFFPAGQYSMQNFKQLTWSFFAICRIPVLLLLSKLMKAYFQAKVHYKRQFLCHEKDLGSNTMKQTGSSSTQRGLSSCSHCMTVLDLQLEAESPGYCWTLSIPLSH